MVNKRLLLAQAILGGLTALNVTAFDELLPPAWFKAVAGLLGAVLAALAIWTAGLHTPAPGQDGE